ncbi:MAG: serine/threonine-protein kinase [Pseudomonadota bacterium]
MPTRYPPDIERRALALFERLAEQPHNARLRARLLKNEPDTVLARLDALEKSATRAGNAIPTLIPGSADAGDAAIPPARVGSFRLIERIGRGGMGDVWAGQRDDGLYDQKVAIKLIQRHALHRAAAAFDDERRFLARLEHPNISRLIDGGVTDEGLPWLVLEYFEGRPIDEAAEGLTDAERVRLIIKAADAVQYAHSHMVAHADLKPSNILVDEQGRVKLLDFGIAALIGGDARSPTGSGPLTREFASPQRISGDGPSVQDDVYALGKTMGRVLDATPDRELRAIIAKAHHADPLIRYGSVAALIADLDRWRARLPVAALPDGWQYRATKFVERHRTGVFATGVAFAMLATTSLIATSSYVRAERNRAGAEARFGEVRHLSGFMLYDLYDALARQPGTVGKRAEIAETSALYLDRLQVAPDAPADLRLETARGYRRLAAIQGLPATSNLGQPDKALVSLKRAEGLLRTLLKRGDNNAAVHAELGWVLADRWSLHAEGDESKTANADARTEFARALSISPSYQPARLGQIATKAFAAYDLIWSADKPAEALRLARTALGELRDTRWPAGLAAAASNIEILLLNRIGDALYYTDDIPGSLAPYREADGLVDHRITIDGATPALLIRKGENAFNISGSLGDMGGHETEALAVARGGVASLKQLLASGPDAAAEKKLLVLYGQEAAVLDQLGRSREAVEPARASVALRERRLATSPGNPQRMRDLAIGIAPYAELLGKAGERANACAAATRAVDVWAEIRARGQLGALDASKNVPHAGTLKEKFCRG